MNIFEPKHNSEGVVELYGRNSILAKIHDYVVNDNMPENIALLGVKGTGKTSVLKNAFSQKNNKKYYDEANVLVAHVSIPESNESMKGFYSYLHSSILNAVDAIEQYDESRYEALMTQILEKKNKILSRSIEVDDATMENVLIKTIEVIKQASLKILVVFDDFERFADSSKLKNAQYKFMRELANSNRISLFISTGQDLTKVSEEMKGSGFENIFRYEELRGIRGQDIEDWVYDVTDETDIEFDDDLMEWIEDVSGGIPELIKEAANVSYQLQKDGVEFDEDVYINALYPAVDSLMKVWWSYTDDTEHKILKEILSNTSNSSISRDCLVKKGYLNEDDEEVSFVSPLFEKYIKENTNSEESEEETSNADFDDIKEMMQQMFKEANDEMASRITKIDSRISDISERLTALANELPSKEEFISSGKFDSDKYKEAISDYISDKLVETDEEALCKGWNIPKDLWDSFSDIRKNDCAMAYKLISYIFTSDIEKLDYTPVTVMLGNFLEGILNDTVLPVMKKHLPEVAAKTKTGEHKKLKNFNEEMTIGGFKFVLENNNTKFTDAVCNETKAMIMDLRTSSVQLFIGKLKDCHKIRNKADHPGDITSHKDKSTFIRNMFIGKDSMLSVMNKIRKLA